jgi:hypothetical protein
MFLSMQVFYHGLAIPLFGALMSKKSERLYTAVLRFISERWPDFQPTEIMVDFEQALHKSARSIWPNAAVHGCRFHFAQACVAQIQQKGLAKEYIKNPGVKKWLKRAIGLCLLPASVIQAIWEQHCQLLAEFSGNPLLLKKLKAYQKYVERFWLNRITAAVFSVFGLEHKTNNHAESLNARLAHDFKSKHPGFWRFLALFEQYCIGRTTDDLALIREGRLPRRLRSESIQVDGYVTYLIFCHNFVD